MIPEGNPDDPKQKPTRPSESPPRVLSLAAPQYTEPFFLHSELSTHKGHPWRKASFRTTMFTLLELRVTFLHEGSQAAIPTQTLTVEFTVVCVEHVRLISPQVRLRKHCYEFTFLYMRKVN